MDEYISKTKFEELMRKSKCVHNPTFATFADVQLVNRWISVKDRLPDDCVEVLVHDTDCGIVIRKTNSLYYHFKEDKPYENRNRVRSQRAAGKRGTHGLHRKRKSG